MKRRKPRTMNRLPEVLASLLDNGQREQAQAEAARTLELVLQRLELAELVTDFS
jgi:hypothetical protein